jgi:hypothetical protein
MQEHRSDGEVLSLFTSPRAALFAWAAVVTSAIIDSRILYHVDLTITLGTWIKTHVEPAFYPSRITGWEAYLADSSRLLASRSYPLLRLNANLLTLVLFSATVFVFSGLASSTAPSDTLRRICRAGCAAALVVCFLAGLHFHFAEPSWVLFCVAAVAVGLVANAVAWRRWDGQPPQGSAPAASTARSPGTRTG